MIPRDSGVVFSLWPPLLSNYKVKEKIIKEEGEGGRRAPFFHTLNVKGKGTLKDEIINQEGGKESLLFSYRQRERKGDSER